MSCRQGMTIYGHNLPYLGCSIHIRKCEWFQHLYILRIYIAAACKGWRGGMADGKHSEPILERPPTVLSDRGEQIDQDTVRSRKLCGVDLKEWCRGYSTRPINAGQRRLNAPLPTDDRVIRRSERHRSSETEDKATTIYCSDSSSGSEDASESEEDAGDADRSTVSYNLLPPAQTLSECRGFPYCWWCKPAKKEGSDL